MVCLAMVVLTFLLPAIHAGMLQLHRLTQHGPAAMVGPTALQNLTSLANHAAPAEFDVPGDHPSSGQPGSVPTGWIQVVDDDEGAEAGGVEPLHSDVDTHGHVHPHAAADEPTPLAPSEPHRHGDWVHSHEDGEEELEALAASLLKLFLGTGQDPLPTISLTAAEPLVASFAAPDALRRIDVPPPRRLFI